MRTLDNYNQNRRSELALLLLLGAAGHTFGSFKAYSQEPRVLLWALCANVLAPLLAALNLLRTNRPTDRALAWISSVETACWLLVAIAFGILINKPSDPRVGF